MDILTLLLVFVKRKTECVTEESLMKFGIYKEDKNYVSFIYEPRMVGMGVVLRRAPFDKLPSTRSGRTVQGVIVSLSNHSCYL